MAGTKTLGGVAQLRIGATTLFFNENLKHNFQQFVSSGRTGRDGVFHGRTKKPNTPYLEGEFTHMPGWTTADYEGLSGDVVANKVDGAGTLVLRDGYVAGEIEIDDDDAKVKLRFEGASGEEI